MTAGAADTRKSICDFVIKSAQSRATGAEHNALACRRRSTWRRAVSVAAWDIPDIVAERHQPGAVAAVTGLLEFVAA
jgi:hypothetical protein